VGNSVFYTAAVGVGVAVSVWTFNSYPLFSVIKV
jgi:hypothetical protein